MDKTIKVGIVGATGYTGSELLRLLANRSDVEITAITSRTEAGKSVTELFPFLRLCVFCYAPRRGDECRA